MSWSALLVLLLWPVVAVALFRVLPPVRAVIAGYLIAWLFLPVVTFAIRSLPDYNKIAATSFGVVLGVSLLDFSRLKTVRVSLIDLPMILFCLSAFPPAIANGIGAYDGVSAVTQRVIIWGIPYALGRLYLNNLAALRDMALGIVISGLVYLPLCLVEIVYGPYLQAWVYGISRLDLEQAKRFGGWRPIVFMADGLMLAVWLACATVVAVWLWRSQALTRGRWSVPLLGLITLLAKSVNGWVLLGVGLVLLEGTTRLRRAWPVYALVAVVLAYVVVRASGVWSATELVAVTQTLVNADRAQSLQFRFENEASVIRHVESTRIVGMGRRPLDYYPPAIEWRYIMDSLWIIVYAETGWLGLLGVLAVLVGPPWLFVRRYPVQTWRVPAVAPAAALVVCLCLYAVDNLLNAMVNPIFMLIAGGLVGLPAEENT